MIAPTLDGLNEPDEPMALDPNSNLVVQKSQKHRDQILHSEQCGCYYCIQLFPPSEINDWIDDDQTAMCPKCGIDSVLPGSQVKLSEEFLIAAGKKWFSV